MRFKNVLPLLFLSVVLTLMLVSCSFGQTTAPDTTSSSEVPSTNSIITDVVAAEGIVVPEQEADLSFKSSGQLQSLLVTEGDKVVAGQELARLETDDLEQMVAKAEAGLKSAQAQLDKLRTGARPEEIASARAAVAIAEADITAAEGDAEVSEGNVTAAEADYQIAEDAVAVAEGNVAAARATLASANANLNKLQKGVSEIRLQIARKEVERARNELYGVQQQRDVSRNFNEGQIAAYETAVEIAQLLLDDLKAGTREEDIAIAQAQVAEAQAGVSTTRAQTNQAQSQVLQAQAKIDIAKSQLKQAQARVESAKARAQQAQAELDLLESGSRSEDIAVAEAAVTEAEALLQEARNALDDAVLYAPFDATVGDIAANVGEIILPQVPVIRLGDLIKFTVETEDLSEVDIDQVAVGQPATITVDALGGEVFDGVVSRVAVVAVDRRGDQVYTVTIDLDAGLESGLRWGMSAFVEIDVN